MPSTLAEMMIGNVLQQNDTRTDPGNAFSAGAQIALHGEELQKQQQQLQMQKTQLQEAKVDKVMNWFEKSANMPDGQVKNAFLKNYIPNGINALGLSDAFHPDSLKMAQSDPVLMAYVGDELKSGRLKASDLYKAMGDPDTMASLASSDGFKQFGGAQAIKETLQNSIGELKAAADVAAQNSFKDKELKTRLEEARATAKMRLDAQDSRQDKSLSHQDANLAAKQYAEFQKTVNNPTSRSTLGLYKSMIGAADAVSTMVNAGLKPDATKEERIKHYDALDSRQIAETVKGLDRLLSRSNPTVHGQESLTPETYQGLAQKYGEKVTGSPRGARQGEFVDRLMKTVDQERRLNAALLNKSSKELKKGFSLAEKVYGSEMDDTLKTLTDNPLLPDENAKLKAAATDYLQKYPNGSGAAKAQAILSGGG